MASLIRGDSSGGRKAREVTRGVAAGRCRAWYHQTLAEVWASAPRNTRLTCFQLSGPWAPRDLCLLDVPRAQGPREGAGRSLQRRGYPGPWARCRVSGSAVISSPSYCQDESAGGGHVGPRCGRKGDSGSEGARGLPGGGGPEETGQRRTTRPRDQEPGATRGIFPSAPSFRFPGS